MFCQWKNGWGWEWGRWRGLFHIAPVKDYDQQPAAWSNGESHLYRTQILFSTFSSFRHGWKGLYDVKWSAESTWKGNPPYSRVSLLFLLTLRLLCLRRFHVLFHRKMRSKKEGKESKWEQERREGRWLLDVYISANLNRSQTDRSLNMAERWFVNSNCTKIRRKQLRRIDSFFCTGFLLFFPFLSVLWFFIFYCCV